MKKYKAKKQIIEELKRVPIIQVACEKSGVSRNSFYVWKKEDEKFSEQAEHAIEEGVGFVNDLTENQLLTMIKDKEWPAIQFWLKHRNKNYRDKVEVTTKIIDENLTPEQEEIVKQALEFGNYISNDNKEKNE